MRNRRQPLAVLALAALGGCSAPPVFQVAEVVEEPTCVAPERLPEDPVGRLGVLNVSEDALVRGAVHLLDLVASDDNQRLYATGWGGLLVFDITGDAPTVLGTYPDPLEQHQVALLPGDIVVTTDRDLGIQLVDASDPANMRWLIAVTLPDVSGVAAMGSVLVAVTHTGEIVLTDFTTPDRPTLLGRANLLGNPWEVVVEGTRAYVADNTLGVVVLDLSDPTSPVVVAEVPAVGGVEDVALGAGALYAAIGSKGVEVFDLTDPDAPVSVGTVDVGGSATQLGASADSLWVANFDGGVLLDLADPLAPSPAGFEPTEEWAMCVLPDPARPGHAWLCGWSYLLHVQASPTPGPEAVIEPATVTRPPGAGEVTFSVTNRGATPLSLVELSTEAEGVTLGELPGTLESGEAVELTVQTSDASPDTFSVCVVSEDADQPVQDVTVTTGEDLANQAVGDIAVDFALPDLDATTWRLSEQLGKPVLLVYFATW